MMLSDRVRRYTANKNRNKRNRQRNRLISELPTSTATHTLFVHIPPNYPMISATHTLSRYPFVIRITSYNPHNTNEVIAVSLHSTAAMEKPIAPANADQQRLSFC